MKTILSPFAVGVRGLRFQLWIICQLLGEYAVGPPETKYLYNNPDQPHGSQRYTSNICLAVKRGVTLNSMSAGCLRLNEVLRTALNTWLPYVPPRFEHPTKASSVSDHRL